MAPEKVSINNLIFESDIYSHTQHTQNKPEYVRVTKGRTWEMSDSVCPGVALAELPKAACIVWLSAVLTLLSHRLSSAHSPGGCSGELGWLMEGIPGGKTPPFIVGAGRSRWGGLQRWLESGWKVPWEMKLVPPWATPARRYPRWVLLARLYLHLYFIYLFCS